MVHHGIVAESLVEALITDMRTSVHGELSSRNQIVDHLLDLRLICRDNPTTLAVIDRLLGELPGRTTVPNAWWLEALLEIERTIRPAVAATRPTASGPASNEPVPGSTPLPRRRGGTGRPQRPDGPPD